MPKSANRSYPAHPFPILSGDFQATPKPDIPPSSLTKAEKRVLGAMQQGGRILLDINAKRGLLYTFARGAVVLGEVTVRAISRLIKQGVLQVCGRVGGVIHYALPHQAERMGWWLKDSDEGLLQIS